MARPSDAGEMEELSGTPMRSSGDHSQRRGPTIVEVEEGPDGWPEYVAIDCVGRTYLLTTCGKSRSHFRTT